MEAVRARVGDDFIVGVRIGADESNEGGTPPEEGVEVARQIGAHGTMDFVNVNGAYSGTLHDLGEAYPGMAFRSAPYIELARRVREASGLPVLQAARLLDATTADWAIGEGHVDLAGLTRPHIADPHLVNKLMRGEEARIRPCVGAGYCIDRVYGGADTLCALNVSTSREAWLPHEIAPAESPRRVVVGGGGPAGIEAARVSALRGHAVTLHEAETRLGGQILLAARADWRKDLIGIADWLAGELDVLGVDVRLNDYVEGPEVLAVAPDAVVVATGGAPDMNLEDGGGDLAVSTWELLSGESVPGENILVYDETGGHGAIATADWLAANGASVDMATPDLHVGRAIDSLNIPVYLGNLYRSGATLTPNHRLKGIRRDGNALVAISCGTISPRVRVERRFDIRSWSIPAPFPPTVPFTSWRRSPGTWVRSTCTHSSTWTPQPVPAVPHWRRRCPAQHSRRHAGRQPALQGAVTEEIPCPTPVDFSSGPSTLEGSRHDINSRPDAGV